MSLGLAIIIIAIIISRYYRLPLLSQEQRAERPLARRQLYRRAIALAKGAAGRFAPLEVYGRTQQPPI
jgi:hypothetical protein